MIEYQSIEHLKAEIDFRAKLARQHVTGEILLPDYYDKPTHDAILRERMVDTENRMRRLLDAGIAVSPFIEFGAERGQRSLAMVNTFNAMGIAADISWHQLRTAEHFAALFGKPELPLRVCCDLRFPPFRHDAFALAFCFAFLHHFPDPGPILRQGFRLLRPNGCFMFAEEPYKRPRLVLYRRRNKIYADAARNRRKWIRYLERFFSESHSDERESGVLENDRIPIRTWANATAVFDRHEIRLQSLEGRIRSRLYRKPGLRNGINALLGGGIEGMGWKTGPKHSLPDTIAPEALLCCPDCLEKSHANQDQSSEPATSSGCSGNGHGLRKTEKAYVCRDCDTVFPIVEGVTMLLPTKLRKQLYPAM